MALDNAEWTVLNPGQGTMHWEVMQENSENISSLGEYVPFDWKKFRCVQHNAGEEALMEADHGYLEVLRRPGLAQQPSA